MVRSLSWVHKTWDVAPRGRPVREYWSALGRINKLEGLPLAILDATTEKLGGRNTFCVCLMPLTPDVQHIKVDEKAGICITTGVSGGRNGLTSFLALSRGVFLCGSFKLALVARWHSCCLQWYVHFLSFCEYDNSYSYLVLMTFECDMNEIWHMGNNFTAVNKFATAQSAYGLVPYVAEIFHHYCAACVFLALGRC